ncbi:MAG TPA: glycine oxidase ThiO [bacterium]
MKSDNDILIIGGGIIGCSIAWRLAQQKARVTVIEKGEPGLEASWAAAGMLAPQSESAHGLRDAMSALCYASHALYPEFIDELQAASGVNIGYRTTGSIYLAADFNEAEALAGLVERQLTAGRRAEELSHQQLHEMEPALTSNIEAAIFLPDDHHVDNRALMKALVSAGSAVGVKFLNHTQVVGLVVKHDRAAGLRTATGVLECDKVINAAGCWAGVVETGNRLKLPLRPIRGQIVCLEMQPQPLHHLIHSAGCYLVPWPDGRILVGATLENAGFDKRVTAAGVQQLLAAAIKSVPALASASMRDTWAGLRPDTPDNLPILGETAIANLFAATGHFRNGILLAPITAKLVSEVVLSGESPVSLGAFRPQRFENQNG